MRIALTQAEGRLGALAPLLRERGFEVLRTPLIETRPLPGARAQAAALLECPWLLFSSRSAVDAWTALRLPLTGLRLGATGSGTAGALRRSGGSVAVTGEPETALGLARVFLEHPEARGPVGLPRGDRALPDLEDALLGAGLEVRSTVIYRTAALPWRSGEVDAVLLASPSAVAALPEAVGRRARLVALGPTTGAAIRGRGWACAEALRPDAEAVLEALQGEPTGASGRWKRDE